MPISLPPLLKLSATGNDFILVDLTHATWPSAFARSEFVKQACDRHDGIGADGFIFVESDRTHAFAWDFYNSDGSSAEMCGNAARAVSLYWNTRTGLHEFEFRTRTGPIKAHVVSAEDVRVNLAPIAEADWNQWSRNGVDELAYDFVRAGVPHAVLSVPDISDRERLTALAQEIKREPRFRAAGTNVTFVHPVSAKVIESVTFERGVEGFTLSCGTGAVAAAYTVLRGEQDRPLEVRVPGGRLLVVWKHNQPILQGPARIIAESRWLLGG